MLSVLADPILPVFAILAIGFALGRFGWMSVEEARLVNRLAMTVLIPIVLFDLLANAPYATFAPRALLVYVGVEAAVFASTVLVCRRLFGLPAGEAVILGFASIFTNNVFYGLPIAVLLYGEDGVLPIMTIIILDSTVAMGGTMIALQAIRQGSASPLAVLGIFWRTPALLAMLAGLAYGATGLRMPAPVLTFLDFNGEAAAPVALFALGVVLSSTRFGWDGAVAATVGIKLLLFPAAIALGLVLFAGGAGETGQRFVFGSAGPSGATAFSLALLYNVPTERIAQVLVWTSLLSLLTLAILA
ncbi:AEC family transporter [Jannaschia seohaensis]|uniref:Malonate transporter n=1 Tax=Jannaschia seohaensis TaxID=475081 RepID=A0A2Y9B7G6_9RHOB|nr:AEC family transporter [Jannaschia seohaensis]PWJ12446.1 hypothetical protein BCF38_1164 [Jannaschia seohaensis]SSA50927.1 hypothetical protein SAMN05421539_1164 [Jannaschia seohaensis]